MLPVCFVAESAINGNADALADKRDAGAKCNASVVVPMAAERGSE